jgi:hypothetical protein
MKKFKYIVFNNDTPVLFPTSVKHNEIKLIFPRHGTATPTSAGFVKLLTSSTGFVAETFGRSVSLNLNASKIDESLIENMINKDY